MSELNEEIIKNISNVTIEDLYADFNADFAKYVEETLKFQENIKEQLEGLSVNEEK